eukprot:scaffold16433_cov21-Tisochrysis_lutea.AAC.4
MAFIIWDAIKWSSAGMGHLATCDPPSYPCSHMINPSTMIRQSDEDDVLRPVEGSPKVLHGAGKRSTMNAHSCAHAKQCTRKGACMQKKASMPDTPACKLLEARLAESHKVQSKT